MEYDKGYIRLNRRFFSDIMWTEARTFSSCEAWLDIIQSARFDATPRKVSIGGREVVVCRGQFAASIRFLAKRWQWGERKVRYFLAYLKKQNLITSECSQGINLITILDYDGYSGNASWDTTKDTSWDTVKDTTITQSINNLQELKTQPKTQVRTQPSKNTKKGQNLGHSRDTKLNKEEESILSNLSKEIKENTPYGVSKKIEKDEAEIDLITSENTPPPDSAPPPSPTSNETGLFDSFEDFKSPNLSSQERKSCAKKKDITDAVLLADKREQEFRESLKQYTDKYDAQMLRDFFDYWTERNKSRTMMRFEKQSTWDLSRRLARWDRNNGKYTNNYGRKEQRQFGNIRPGDFAGKGYTDI